MSTSIEALRAYAVIGADLTELKRGVQDADAELSKIGANASAAGLSEFVGRISAKLNSVGSSLTGIGIGLTAAFTAPVGLAVKAASDLSETVNKVDVVFGSASGSIQQFAQGSASAMGLSRQKALEAAASFGNLFVTIGSSGDEAAKMSVAMVRLATDLASFHNIRPEEALEKLQSGLVGEARPLREVGILLNETATKAEAAKLGFKGVGGELTEQQKVLARYNLILQQSGTAQGDFARTADGLANTSRIVRAQIEDLAANLGSVLLPVAQKALHVFSDLLAKFQQLPEGLQQTIVVIAGVGAVLGPLVLIAGQFISAIGTIGSAVSGITGLFSAFGGAAGAAGAAAGGAEVAVAGLGASFAAIAAPIAIAVAAIAAVAAAIASNVGGVRDKIGALISELQDAFSRFVDFLSSMKDSFEQIWNGVLTILGGVVAAVGDILGGLVDVIRAILAAIQGDWSKAGELLKSASVSIWQGIVSLVVGVVSGLVNILSGLWDVTTNVAIAAWNLLKDSVVSLAQIIVDSVVEFFSTLPERAGAFLEALPGVAGQALGLLAGEAYKYISEFVTTIIDGVSSLGALIWSALKSALNAVVAFFVNLFTTGRNGAQSFLAGVWEFLKDLPQLFVDAVQAVFNFLVELPAKLLAWGKSIASSFWSGLQSGFAAGQSGALENTLSGVVGAIGESTKQNITSVGAGLKNSMSGMLGGVGEAGKSEGNKAGVKIGAGLGEGIKKGHKQVKEGFDDLTKHAQEDLQGFLQTLGFGIKLTKQLWNGMTSDLKDALKSQSKAWADGQREQDAQLASFVARSKVSLDDVNNFIKASGVDAKVSAKQFADAFGSSADSLVPLINKVKEAQAQAELLRTKLIVEFTQSLPTIEKNVIGVGSAFSRLSGSSSLAFEQMKSDVDNFVNGVISGEGSKMNSAIRSIETEFMEVARSAHLSSEEGKTAFISFVDTLANEVGGKGAEVLRSYTDQLRKTMAEDTAKGVSAATLAFAEFGDKSVVDIARVKDAMADVSDAVAGSDTLKVKDALEKMHALFVELGAKAGISLDEIETAFKRYADTATQKGSNTTRQVATEIEAAFARIVGASRVMQSALGSTFSSNSIILAQFRDGFTSLEQAVTAHNIPNIVSALDSLHKKVEETGRLNGLTTKQIEAQWRQLFDAAKQQFPEMTKLLEDYDAIQRKIGETDAFQKLADAVGGPIANVIKGALKGLGDYSKETLEKIGEFASGIQDIVGSMPGKIGDSLRKVQSEIERWVTFINGVLKVLHGIWNSVPESIEKAVESIISIFQKSTKTIADTATTSQDAIQKAAKKASAETEGMASSVEGSTSKMGKAFAVAASAVGAFVTGLATANATGSKLIGSLTGGLQGAMSGFAAGGPIGAVIGGIGGILGGLFGGGKSAAQKQKEKLELERLKQDVQKGAQEVMQAAFDTMQKALETFEKLADFTKTPRRLISLFFAQMQTVIKHFIALAAVWSVQMLDAAKRFAESIGPVLETIGVGVEAFEKLSFFTGVPDKALVLFFVALERTLALFNDISDNWTRKALRIARRFAGQASDIVTTIGTGVEAFLRLNDYKGISAEIFDLFARDLEFAVNRMIEVSDNISNRFLKQAQRFSDRTLSIVALIKEGVDAFQGINDYKAISAEIFDQFLADLRMAVEKMQIVVGAIDTEMLSMASAFAQKSMSIFAAIKAGVEAFTALRDYKAIPAEILNQFLDDFKNAIALLKETLAVALEGEELAAKFQEAALKIADSLTKAGQTLAGIGGSAARATTAVVAVGAATVMGVASAGSASTFTPAALTTQTTSIVYGSTTTHIEEGPIYLQVDMRRIKDVEDLIDIMNEARQKRRARKVA